MRRAAYAVPLPMFGDITIMPKLKFYEVDAEYIRYLSAVDSRVPKIDYSESGRHNRFLCGIVLSVGGHNYFAPVSSFKTQQRSNFIIEDAKDNPVSSLRFSYMIPVPDSAVSLKDIGSEKPAYKNLLNLEPRYINRNATAVFTRARYVYQLAVQKKDSVMVKNCCDFKALEDACAEYERNK
jgi:protein AbiQ